MRAYLLALLLLISVPTYAAHVVSPQAKIDLDTQKIIVLHGEVNEFSAITFLADLRAVKDILGALLVIIDSPGGDVESGDRMIAAIDEIEASGTKVVCVANHAAHSMAFNLLTHCNVRLATPRTTMVVHKIEISRIAGVRNTAANLRRIANQLDRRDEKYRQANSKAMKLTLSEYDICADNETEWGAMQLLERGYLQGIALLSQ